MTVSRRSRSATVDDPELDQSPTAQLNALKQALQQYANAPDNTTLAQAAVTSAKDMATALNQATQTVQSVREGADADMATSVENINQLLSQFQTVNTAIVKGTIAGDDVTDYLDQRDSIVSKLSQELGVTMSIRPNGDAALYTDSGVVLFDKTARAVSFAPTNAYTAGTTGNAVYIDGVPVTGANSVMPLKSGKLAGLAQLRDNATVTYQSQLDEVARGLINTFKESRPVRRRAARRARPLHLSRRAGDARERDRLGRPRRHDHGCRIGRSGPGRQPQSAARRRDQRQRRLQIQHHRQCRLLDAASAAHRQHGCVAAVRRDHARQAERQPDRLRVVVDELDRKPAQDRRRQRHQYQNTLLDRSTAALSNVSGVNMDDEMSLMLQVERTYSASSKIISTVDQMLQSLLAAVGN